jgi:hypothetical protein
MNRAATTLAAVLFGSLLLGGCGSVSDFTIDPQEWFAGDFLGNKKKLEGPRKPVFPEGVPGVTKGVPPDLIKGQAAAGDQDASPMQGLAPEDPKPKPKSNPKPKVAAKPRPPVQEEPESRPTPITVRRTDAPAGQPQQPAAGQWPDPTPTRQQQPAATAWPDPPQPQTQSRGVQWPDPPPTR